VHVSLFYRQCIIALHNILCGNLAHMGTYSVDYYYVTKRSGLGERRSSRVLLLSSSKRRLRAFLAAQAAARASFYFCTVIHTHVGPWHHGRTIGGVGVEA